MTGDTADRIGDPITGLWLQLPSAFAMDADIGAAFTTRTGGHSRGAWGGSTGAPGLNLGLNTGDDRPTVLRNRAAVTQAIGRPVRWLQQVHGTVVVGDDDGASEPHVDQARVDDPHGGDPHAGEPRADAAVTQRDDVALAVLVADCLPVLFTSADGRCVGAAHAGWRGLAGGVIEATVEALRQLQPGAEWRAWAGPCIGAARFEVGPEVRAAFCDADPAASGHFRPFSRDGRWMADLRGLARQRLDAAGVRWIDDDAHCTVDDPARFWSYRRDGVCGRMAALIWREPVVDGDRSTRVQGNR